MAKRAKSKDLVRWACDAAGRVFHAVVSSNDLGTETFRLAVCGEPPPLCGGWSLQTRGATVQRRCEKCMRMVRKAQEKMELQEREKKA